MNSNASSVFRYAGVGTAAVLAALAGVVVAVSPGVAQGEPAPCLPGQLGCLVPTIPTPPPAAAPVDPGPDAAEKGKKKPPFSNLPSGLSGEAIDSSHSNEIDVLPGSLPTTTTGAPRP